jgi:hypothetical protein
VADIVSEQPQPLARPRPEPVVSRRKFGAAYLALAAIIGAAVGLVVVFSTRNDSHSKSVAWSGWAPLTTGTLGAREIARHVSTQYRLPNGALLTSVIAGPMVIESSQGEIPVEAILVRSGTAGVTQERIDIAFPTAGVFYQLVGTGPGKSIPGTATKLRGQLVLREVVQLALTTFHNMPQADYILAFLPPPAGVAQTSPIYSRAVLLSRKDLRDELSVPLSQALPPGDVKLTANRFSPAMGNAIDGITTGHVFHYDFQQAANNGVLVVLSPLP